MHCKRAEDHQKKKQVVDTESFLDQIAGEKFECGLLPAKIKHSQSEEHGNPNPAKTENGRLAQPNFVCVPVKNAQIQHNRNEDANVEKEPIERRAHNGAIPPQGLELIPSVVFRFESSTRAARPASIFTGTSQWTRMSPALASRFSEEIQ